MVWVDRTLPAEFCHCTRTPKFTASAVVGMFTHAPAMYCEPAVTGTRWKVAFVSRSAAWRRAEYWPSRLGLAMRSAPVLLVHESGNAFASSSHSNPGLLSRFAADPPG